MKEDRKKGARKEEGHMEGDHMKVRPVPAFPTWLLRLVLSGNRREALLGDLWEEFQRGRTTGWYWRETLAALGVCILGDAPRSRPVRLSIAVIAAIGLGGGAITWARTTAAPTAPPVSSSTLKAPNDRHPVADRAHPFLGRGTARAHLPDR